MAVLLLVMLSCGGGASPEAEPGPAPDVVLVTPAEVDARWVNARCNDGSPFALSLRDVGADRWVIKVAGGYFCDDDVTPCAGREKRFTRAPREAQLDGGGLFSRDPAVNPHLAGANQVELHYCSSDLWLGDATEKQETSGDPSGWYFSGRHNLSAGLEVLKRDHGLDDADQVLIVGHSAGGMGVVGNFDVIVSLLPEAAKAGRLKVVLDGAWVPPQDDLVATPKANRWGPLHPRCQAALQARGDEPLKCVFGPVWYPYLRDTGVPVLIAQSGADVTQLKAYNLAKGPKVAAWRRNAQASFADVPWLFSGGSRYHVVSFDPKFDAGDPSFADVFGRFWAGGPPERVLFDYDGGE